MKKMIAFLIAASMLTMFSYGRDYGEDRGVRFFSPGSLYFYVEGASTVINPYEPYEFWAREGKFSMVYGGGFTLFNFHNRYKINFEFDYSQLKYDVFDTGYTDIQKINFYNFTLNFEYIFRRSRLSVFGGLGVSSINLLENDLFYEATYTGMLFQIGLKVGLSRHLFFRTEFKHMFEPDDSYDYYYDDSYPLASSFAFGIEIKI